MKPEYVYVTEKHVGNGMFCVEGRKADGSLSFGFRTFDPWYDRREKARLYAGNKLPVFDGRGGQAKLIKLPSDIQKGACHA